MKLGLITNNVSVNLVALAAAAMALGGCSFTANPLNQPPSSSNADTNPDGGAPANAPPPALGTITVGESHESGSTTTTFVPEVAASFIPDSTVVPTTSCTTTTESVSGCTITPVAQATCPAAPSCTVQCPSGEVCYFATSSTQGCRPIQSFDAGDLILSGGGIATPITLIPPDYQLTTTSLQNPLVWGGEIQVTSSGSAGAGFQAFQETVKATTLMQTSPSLSTLTSSNVFAGSGFTIGWTPGADSVSITLTGTLGTAVCPATDSTGSFTIPNPVVLDVAPSGSAVSVSVARQHLEQKTDDKTQGTLVGETVQPVGYLDLSTISVETYQIEGCGTDGTEAVCSGVCVDTSSSATNCGSCGHSCGSGYCESGVCYGTTGTCTSPYTSCPTTGCVDLQTSPTNCGDCGYVCPSSSPYCVSGLCTTSSSCTSGYTSCSDGCQDLQISSTDCGSCGNSCDGGTCSGGVCSTSSACTSCEESAELSSGVCGSYATTCNGDANCTDFMSCMSGCTTGDTTCQSTCQEDYSTGASEAQALQNCICGSACESQCGSTTVCTTTL
jgi:hypothetical protein